MNLDPVEELSRITASRANRGSSVTHTIAQFPVQRDLGRPEVIDGNHSAVRPPLLSASLIVILIRPVIGKLVDKIRTKETDRVPPTQKSQRGQSLELGNV